MNVACPARPTGPRALKRVNRAMLSSLSEIEYLFVKHFGVVYADRNFFPPFNFLND